MSSTTFTMRIDTQLKQDIQTIADNMGMSSTALVQLVLRSFIMQPKIELDLSEEKWYDDMFEKPVPIKEFIGGLKDSIGKTDGNGLGNNQ